MMHTPYTMSPTRTSARLGAHGDPGDEGDGDRHRPAVQAPAESGPQGRSRRAVPLGHLAESYCVWARFPRDARHRRRSAAAPSRVSPLAIVSRPRRASLTVAASTSRSHCSIADRRSLRMHTCGSAASSCGELDRRRRACARCGDPVGQADALGLDAVDPAAGEDQVDGPAVADQAGQVDRAEVDERHAEAPAVHAEHGVGGDDAQVAPQRQLQPAGDGRTLDGGDHRLRQAHPRSAPSARARSSPTGRRSPSLSALRSAPAQK